MSERRYVYRVALVTRGQSMVGAPIEDSRDVGQLQFRARSIQEADRKAGAALPGQLQEAWRRAQVLPHDTHICIHRKGWEARRLPVGDGPEPYSPARRPNRPIPPGDLVAVADAAIARGRRSAREEQPND